MISSVYRRVLSVVALASVTYGCTGSVASLDAHILNPAEFNREHANFVVPLKDRAELTVCYSAYNSTSDQVLDLARNECSKFGKKAYFKGTRYDKCPLFTPTSAVFACALEQAEGAPASGAGVSGVVPSGGPAQAFPEATPASQSLQSSPPSPQPTRLFGRNPALDQQIKDRQSRN